MLTDIRLGKVLTEKQIAERRERVLRYLFWEVKEDHARMLRRMPYSLFRQRRRWK